ncbi:MAG: LysM peptidoglycan-binding domain-containing protein [Verrucomicrobiales bacterium]|jgi:LysM repeat protein|nr:LysM peptidoglycan-binding domain-containing protein [Verrucomicrobiales bacterium]
MNEEMNEQSSKTLASPKLSKVVLIVLAAHVVLILGFGTYCLLKGNTSGKGDTEVTANSEDSIEQVASSGSGQPTVETNAPEAAASPVSPVTTETAANSQPATTTGSSMPNTQDPIWNSAASNRPLAQTTTVAPQVAQNTAPAPSAGSYTVQKGDSLYKIARKNGVTVPELKQANGLTSDALKIGQTLNIPSKGAAAPAGAPVMAANSQPVATTSVAASTQSVVHAAVANSNTGSFQSYKVAPGDTLWKIAKNFNTKPDVIARANGISDPSKLKVGMEIKVPAQTRETAQPAPQPQAAIPNVDVAGLPHNRS